MIYVESTNLIIYWDEEVECVHIECKGFAYGEMYREGLNKGLQLLINKKSRLWLADLQKMRLLNQEDQKWTNSDWLPRAVLGGMQRMGIVLPQRICQAAICCLKEPYGKLSS